MKKEKGKLQRTKEENNDPEDEELNMQQKRNNAKRNTEEQRGVSRREDREQERWRPGVSLIKKTIKESSNA